jgi:hypothetical protein
MVLLKMKQTAEAYLGTTINNAVVTSLHISTTLKGRQQRMPELSPA